MPVQLNHTIVAARDRQESATFLADLLGLPAPTLYGPFAVVELSNDVSLDFMDDPEAHPRHYAFLVTEPEFDEIFGRIQARGLDYWADPFQQQPGRDQHPRRGPRRLLARPERARPGDHHPALRRLSAPVDSDVLPRLDEHATDIDADAGDVWTALRTTLDATMSRPWSAAAAGSSGAPTPAPPGHVRSTEGSTVPGFRVAGAVPGTLLALEGRAPVLHLRPGLPARAARRPDPAARREPGHLPRRRRRRLPAARRGHRRARGRRAPAAGGGQAPRGAVDGAALSAV